MQAIIVNYLLATGITSQFRSTERLQQIGIYSTLGNASYALYTLDNRSRQAFKATGLFTKGGPTIFANYNNSGRGFEVHKQFNQKWFEDIQGLGDAEDIKNSKTGTFGGPRALVRLPAAGFSIEAAQKLSGFHTHTICSEDFGINSATATGYAPGRFFQVNSSRSSFRMDLRLTDQANDLGGTLANAMQVTETYLIQRSFTIVNVAPLP